MAFFKDVEVVKSETGKRQSKYSEPVLIVTCTKGKIRINSAAGELLEIGNRENLMFIHNGDKDLNTRIYGVLKGYPVLDEVGNPIMVADRMTAKEAKAQIKAGNYTEDEEGNKVAIAPTTEKVTGSRMSITNGNAKRGDFGHTLEGTEAGTWVGLQGNTEVNRVFTLGEGEEVDIEGDGELRMVYPLIFKEEEDKQASE